MSDVGRVTFGSNNQFGDVAIDKVAGGDIITATTTVVQAAAPVVLERSADALRPPLPVRGFRNREGALETLRSELRPASWASGVMGAAGSG
ncbi:hypothetical protein HC891_18405, partial [Candidatus Gracilibacteria bacterium]|nr:hypothetical protein [Candidatus Gracilibacteria bacterium]